MRGREREREREGNSAYYLIGVTAKEGYHAMMQLSLWSATGFAFSMVTRNYDVYPSAFALLALSVRKQKLAIKCLHFFN